MGTDNSLRSSSTPERRRPPRHIIAGWDRATREAARVLLGMGSQVVVVAAARPDDLPGGAGTVEGRPDDPEALRRAGVVEAESVLVALPVPEACRVLAAAASLNPRARLGASVQEAGAGPVLRAAGASFAVDSLEETGREMVRLMLAGTPELDSRGEE